LQRTTVYYHK